MCGIWDVDKLEREIPDVLVVEWNIYLAWEIAQWTKAILNAFHSSTPDAVKLDKPDDICNFLEAIGAK